MSEETDAGLAGTLLAGRYRVGEVLGRGGMGSVYRGTDVVLDRAVALKIFRGDITDRDGLARQQAEARTLARLNHHGLVTLFDTGTVPRGPREVPFLVMELVTGTDLRGRLAAGPLTGSEAARLGAELADALHYIHDRGVVHRDVKPANVLLARYAADAPLHPKLADFGIARMLDSARVTATNAIPGTAAYLSPEQAGGEGAGPPSDIYSLGLVLLEALTGTTAFPGPPLEAAVARLSRNPVIPESLGPRWTSLLGRLTARNPQDRPGAASVAAALRNAAEWATPATRGQGTDAAAAAPGLGEADTAAAAQGPDESDTAVAPREPATRVLAPGGAGLAPGDHAAPPGAHVPALPREQATNATARHTVPRRPARPPASAAPGPERTRRPGGRWLWWLAAAAAAVVLVAVVVLASVPRPAPAPEPSPGPAIPGQLGEHFEDLEESVTP